jgi:hypothetical protein
LPSVRSRSCAITEPGLPAAASTENASTLTGHSTLGGVT